MKELLLVGLGGFVGSTCRYLVSLTTLRQAVEGFPLSTLLVNLSGSLLIGLLAVTLARPQWQSWQLVAIVGFCGGFTTFSTFSMEGLRMLRGAMYSHYALYVFLSVFGGLALCFLGAWIGQKLTGFEQF